MFTSIVVALDLEAAGDRALPLASALAALGGLPVELVTVSSPGMPADVDVYELSQRAKAYGLEHCSCVVLHDNDVGGALVEHLRLRPDALLLMGTSAKGPLAGPLLGSVSEYVLGRTENSVLVAGPNTATGCRLIRPTLVAAVDDSDAVDTAAPAIASWMRTFGGRRTWIAHALSRTEILDGGLSEMRAVESVRHAAERLRAADGIDAVGKVLFGDPITALDEFAQTLDDVVFVVVSSRWTDAHFHCHSVARRLVQRSSRPVLVVPARRDGTEESHPRLITISQTPD